MSLFKSKEERRIERDIQVRQGVSQIRKQLVSLERNEKDYLEKARRARQIGSRDQLAFLKRAIRQTIAQRRAMERQLLAIETAAQIKNQAESFAAFAKSMTAVSRSIAEVFGGMDLSKTQQDFELAMTRARTLEERMNIFLEMTNDTMMGGLEDEQAGITDEELDRLLEAMEAVRGQLDPDVARELDKIERELGGK